MINLHNVFRPRRRLQLSQCLSSRQFKVFIATFRDLLILISIIAIVIIYRNRKINESKTVSLLPNSAKHFVLFQEKIQSQPSTADIRRRIQECNRKQTILNEDIYGRIRRDTVIIVIKVSKLTFYLKYLIVSLSEVKGIQDALLIFSHSYYDENFNEFIRKIDFCRVLQIFFPYSIQANHNHFPDYQKGDCPYDIGAQTGLYLNCTYANSPDLHGKFRDPLKAEQKHHWWWTANQVFENLTISEVYEGIVVFLDDDVYVLEDFLFMLIYMRDTAQSLSQQVIISLGTTYDEQFKEGVLYRVLITSWEAQSSTALAIDLEMWNKIVSFYDVFCNVDDYSWLRSLFHVSLYMNEDQRFKMLSSEVPRVYKINKRGILERLMRSLTLDSVHKILAMQERIKDNLFPPYFEIYTDVELQSQEYNHHFYSNFNGGWSDPRDRMLCWNITVKKIKKLLLNIDIQSQDQYDN